MEYYTTEQIRKIEEDAIRKGMTVEKMMDNAGQGIANFIDKNVSFNKVLFIAGTGNNGGDALSAAFHLFSSRPADIEVFVVGRETELKENPLTFLRLIKDMKDIKVQFLWETGQLDKFEEEVNNSDLLVIGIFGTGFHGALNLLDSNVIDIINKAAVRKISVDIPSGMNSDTGEFEKAVKSDFTITFNKMKKAFLNKKAQETCGDILLVEVI